MDGTVRFCLLRFVLVCLMVGFQVVQSPEWSIESIHRHLSMGGEFSESVFQVSRRVSRRVPRR